MKIGVLSDIHDNIPNLRKALKLFDKKKAERIVFCGDLASAFTVSYFKECSLPVWAVFGNNEGCKPGILQRIEKLKLEFQYAPKRRLMWDLKWQNKRMAAFHGHQYEITDALVNSKLFDLVLTGHTHRSHVKKVGQTIWVNPGSVCGWADLDSKPVKASVAMVDLPSLQAEIIKL